MLLIADTTVISNFFLIGRLDLLEGIKDLCARRFAQRGNIPVSGSIGILVKCVTNGLLSLDQGNELLSQMIQKGFYSPVESLDRFLP